MNWFNRLKSDEERDWVSQSDLLMYGKDYESLPLLSDTDLLDTYDKHESEVFDRFKGREKQLLVVDITRQNEMPASRIVTFLEDNGFLKMPSSNESENWT
jgi:hypothetical protein